MIKIRIIVNTIVLILFVFLAYLCYDSIRAYYNDFSISNAISRILSLMTFNGIMSIIVILLVLIIVTIAKIKIKHNILAYIMLIMFFCVQYYLLHSMINISRSCKAGLSDIYVGYYNQHMLAFIFIIMNNIMYFGIILYLLLKYRASSLDK